MALEGCHVTRCNWAAPLPPLLTAWLPVGEEEEVDDKVAWHLRTPGILASLSEGRAQTDQAVDLGDACAGAGDDSRKLERCSGCGCGSGLVEWSSKDVGKRELMVVRVPRRETRL